MWIFSPSMIRSELPERSSFEQGERLALHGGVLGRRAFAQGQHGGQAGHHELEDQEHGVRQRHQRLRLVCHGVRYMQAMRAACSVFESARKMCKACDDGKIDIPMIIGLIMAFIIGGGIFASGVYAILGDSGMLTDIRLLVGFYQLLGQMNNVLSIRFPEPMPSLLAALSFMFLDLRKLVMLDCWDVRVLQCTRTFSHPHL